MIEHPFDIFRPFADRVRVRLYDRSDNIRCASDIVRAEGLPVADPEQVHGTLTLRTHGPGAYPGADGLVSNEHGLALCTRGADCQMFVAFDPDHSVIGALHAGWRGLRAGAIPTFVETMVREWETSPAALLVAAGPSLCFDCGEFTDPTSELAGIDPRFFRGRLADLCSIATDQFHRAGVRLNHLERHVDCTRCERDDWWTLRGGDRTELETGVRNLMTISLK